MKQHFLFGIFKFVSTFQGPAGFFRQTIYDFAFVLKISNGSCCICSKVGPPSARISASSGPKKVERWKRVDLVFEVPEKMELYN